MINFSKVRYKNFLSTGQQFIEVDLQKSNTTLVVGENGAGKSTMLDALCFGLFQRAFRNIKKDQLINSLNERECVVEVYFTVGQKSYKGKLNLDYHQFLLCSMRIYISKV